MRAFQILGTCVLLAACSSVPVTRAPSDAARIFEVKIRQDQLTIIMTDGARCVEVLPEARETVLSGVTSNCGYALPYELAYPEGAANPVRFVLDAFFTDFGAPDLLMPRATLTVTDVNGAERRFVAPTSAAPVSEESSLIQGSL